MVLKARFTKWFSPNRCEKKEDWPKTTFCIPGGGLWQFKVMPQCSTNSPAVSERLMEQVFHSFNNKTLLIYLDDIIVYGKTFEVLCTIYMKLFRDCAIQI